MKNDLYIYVRIGFDIRGLDHNIKEDQDGIEKSSLFCKFRCLVAVIFHILII